MVLTEGWDMPEVGCCILARPTKQMGLYRQIVGRVLRPAPGKTDAIILDHSGAVFQHGLPEDLVGKDRQPGVADSDMQQFARNVSVSGKQTIELRRLLTPERRKSNWPRRQE
jgi:DNA repair protein RadD